MDREASAEDPRGDRREPDRGGGAPEVGGGLAARSPGEAGRGIAGRPGRREDQRRARPRERDGLEHRRDERLGQPQRGGDPQGRDPRSRPPDVQRHGRVPGDRERRPKAHRARRSGQHLRAGRQGRRRGDRRDDPEDAAARRADRQRLLRAHAPDVLDVIVERASGDLRSAINDLESIAIGKKEVRAASTKSLGYRDREPTIFPVIEEILRSGDARRAREAVRDLDETPEDLILWIDQNLAHEFGRPDDLVRGYDVLSRADLFLGRVRRRQSYGLWSYARELMSSGVAVARRGRARGGQLEFPYYLIQMARSRAQRGARNSVASKFARYLHASQSLMRSDVLPVLKALFAGDEELRIQLTAELGLDEREVASLLDEAEASHAVKHLLEKAAKIAHPKARDAAAGRLHAFDEGETDDA